MYSVHSFGKIQRVTAELDGFDPAHPDVRNRFLKLSLWGNQEDASASMIMTGDTENGSTPGLAASLARSLLESVAASGRQELVDEVVKRFVQDETIKRFVQQEGADKDTRGRGQDAERQPGPAS